MLQDLLPGFRHLRSPLAAGFVWLLGLWLLLHRYATGSDSIGEVRRSLVDLANWAGKPATLAGLTLAAYVIGTISIAATIGVKKATAGLRGTWLQWLAPWYWIEKQADRSIDLGVDRRLSEHYMESQQFRDLLTRHLTECRARALKAGHELYSFVKILPDAAILEKEALYDESTRRLLINTAVRKDQYVESGKQDVRHLAYRLPEQVYSEFSRLRAEGMFRSGLVFPLIFLCSVLSALGSSWWLAGLAAPIALGYLGGESFAESERSRASAVASGSVELPSLERIRTHDVSLVPYEELICDISPSVPPPYIVKTNRR